jgi:cell division protein FtsB
VKDAASHFQHAPPERFLTRLNKILIALIVAAAVIPLTYRVLPGVSEKARQDEMLATMEAQLDEARMVNSRLAREVTLLRNDGEYLSLFARDAVTPGYMKPGETIFRLPARQQ